MSFDDDSTDSYVPVYEDDSTPSAGTDPFFSTSFAVTEATPSAAAHALHPKPLSASAPADKSLTGWRRLLQRECDGSNVSVGSAEMGATIAFDIDHKAPASVLASVSIDVHMMFGCSLQSRLRGLWHDSSFTVDFYIVSDAASPLGISIAGSDTDGFHTEPCVHTVDGSRKVTPCIQEGAMAAIVLRALHQAFASWHTSFFHTAQHCRRAAAATQDEALTILERALDRPCSVDRKRGCITTRDEDGFLPIAQNDLTEGSADFHVRITLLGGCISAIDIDGMSINAQRARALDDARLRLGLRDGPLPVSSSTAAAIVELITGPLVAKRADATPNLFSYLSAYLALSLKNSLVYANSHTGALLPRPSLMPFVPLEDVSLFAIDNGMCGLSLQDALCCIPPNVLKLIFQSAVAASNHVVASRNGSATKFDLCQPWPSFLLKKAVINQYRSGIIEDATSRADTTERGSSQGLKGGTPKLFEPKVAKIEMHAGLGVENKKLEVWQSALSAALLALQDGRLIELMAGARSGIPSLEQRKLVLQQFLATCAEGSADAADATMTAMVCGYVLRTLPYFPAQVFQGLLWFGEQTPWEDGLAQDVWRARAASPALQPHCLCICACWTAQRHRFTITARGAIPCTASCATTC
jgi:hypothetical protein